jgi:hypothetical protein
MELSLRSKSLSLTLSRRGCGAVHAFAADRLAPRPRTPDA